MNNFFIGDVSWEFLVEIMALTWLPVDLILIHSPLLTRMPKRLTDRSKCLAGRPKCLADRSKYLANGSKCLAGTSDRPKCFAEFDFQVVRQFRSTSSVLYHVDSSLTRSPRNYSQLKWFLASALHPQPFVRQVTIRPFTVI